MKKYMMILACALLTCNSQPKQKTFEFWQFWTDPKARPVVQNLVAQFERENPDWKVNITDLTWADGHQKIVVAFGAGNPPDLLELGSDWIAEFVSAGALSEITGDTSAILMAGAGISNGKLYAWPWMIDTRVLYFNRSLLDKAGAKLPSNWAELLDACRKINTLGDGICGFGANSNEPHRLYKKFLPFVWSDGGNIIDGYKISVISPEVLRALSFYGELAQCGRVETQKNLEDAFCDGKLGFVISGGWLLKRLQDKPPSFEYQLSPITPEKTGGAGLSFAGGEYLVIPQKSPNKEAANKLMLLLTQMENSRMLCDSVGFGFPPYRNQNIALKDKAVLFEQLSKSRPSPFNPNWVYIESAIETMVEEVTLGKSTPEQASQTAQAKIDEILKN
jgi:multiple sugar transport system substrate-binding protein